MNQTNINLSEMPVEELILRLDKMLSEGAQKDNFYADARLLSLDELRNSDIDYLLSLLDDILRGRASYQLYSEPVEENVPAEVELEVTDSSANELDLEERIIQLWPTADRNYVVESYRLITGGEPSKDYVRKTTKALRSGRTDKLLVAVELIKKKKGLTIKRDISRLKGKYYLSWVLYRTPIKYLRRSVSVLLSPFKYMALQKQVQNISLRMDDADEQLHAVISTVKGELVEEVSAVKSEMQQAVSDVKEEIQGLINELESQLYTKFEGLQCVLQEHMHQELSRAESRVMDEVSRINNTTQAIEELRNIVEGVTGELAGMGERLSESIARARTDILTDTSALQQQEIENLLHQLSSVKSELLAEISRTETGLQNDISAVQHEQIDRVAQQVSLAKKDLLIEVSKVKSEIVADVSAIKHEQADSIVQQVSLARDELSSEVSKVKSEIVADVSAIKHEQADSIVQQVSLVRDGLLLELSRVKGDIVADMSAIKHEQADILAQQMLLTRDDLLGEVAKAKSEIVSDVSDIKHDIETSVSARINEFVPEISDVKGSLLGEISRTEEKLYNAISAVKEDGIENASALISSVAGEVAVLHDDLEQYAEKLSQLVEKGQTNIHARFGDELDAYYYMFEQKYRGGYDDIKKRLSHYRSELGYFSEISREHPVVDLGSGRGEFLELMSEVGVDAYGVDTNTRMIAACEERGLRVVNSDLFDHLKSLGNESRSAVTAIHVIEHLDTDTLIEFIAELYRVLIPGGMVILETPNPSNMVVGASSFYTDITHVRPVAPQSISLLLECFSFQKVRVDGLHPFSEYYSEEKVDIGAFGENRINNAMDYCVFAYKPSRELK